jgi:cell division protein FtsA
MKKTFAVLDLKSKEITAAAARWGKNKDHVVEALLVAPSEGISASAVTDMNKAADSISEVVRKLSEKTGSRIFKVHTLVSSSSVELVSSTGNLLLSKHGREIFSSDIRKCIEIGSIIKMPQGKEPIHTIIREFFVDSLGGVNNPLGLEAVKLGVCVDVVLIDSSTLRNMEKCISLAGFNAGFPVLASIANSYRVLSSDQVERGICLVDIRKDTTETSLFHKGTLTDYRFMPFDLDELSTELRTMKGWEQVREIVIAGEYGLHEGMAETLREMTGLKTSMGLCISKPLEHLPSDRIRYAGCLGLLDHLEKKKGSERSAGNILKRIFRRICGFMDKYF